MVQTVVEGRSICPFFWSKIHQMLAKHGDQSALSLLPSCLVHWKRCVFRKQCGQVGEELPRVAARTN